MSGGWRQFVLDPEANAAMAAGDYRQARDTFVAIAEPDPGLGSEYLYRAARAALWAGDAQDARALLARLDENGAYGRVADARQATVKAGIAAVEGRSAEALTLYRDALRDWRAAHAVWDDAMTGLDMALLLDPAEPDVAAAIKSTREILERLAAKPYLERLEAAASRAPAPAPPARTARPAAVPEGAVTD